MNEGALIDWFVGSIGRLTVMLSPSGRMLRLFPLKVVCLASSLESFVDDNAVGAPSTAEAAVQSVRRVWVKCMLMDVDQLNRSKWMLWSCSVWSVPFTIL